MDGQHKMFSGTQHGVSPATRLLEMRRQMFEVQETLEEHKAEFNRKVPPYSLTCLLRLLRAPLETFQEGILLILPHAGGRVQEA